MAGRAGRSPVRVVARAGLAAPADFPALSEESAGRPSAGRAGLRAVVLPRRTGARSGAVGRGCLAVSLARMDLGISSRSHCYRAQQFGLDTNLQAVVGESRTVEQKHVFDAFAKRIDPRRVDADMMLGEHSRDGIE
jgi:hypothetical protein